MCIRDRGNTEAAQSSQSPAAEPAPTASAAPAQTAESGSKTVGEYGISGFETRVSELTAKMGTATLQDIGTIKQEMNQLERDMDAAEDQAEWDLDVYKRQGILIWGLAGKASFGAVWGNFADTVKNLKVDDFVDRLPDDAQTGEHFEKAAEEIESISMRFVDELSLIHI